VQKLGTGRGESVQDHLSVAARLGEALGSQEPKMMRDGTHRSFGDPGEVADAQLAVGLC